MIGGRKTRSNKGVRRGSRTGRTRSGRRFRATPQRAVRKTRKQRSNKGVRRGPYGPRTGRTRSGRRFRQAGKGDTENPEAPANAQAANNSAKKQATESASEQVGTAPEPAKEPAQAGTAPANQVQANQAQAGTAPATGANSGAANANPKANPGAANANNASVRAPVPAPAGTATNEAGNSGAANANPTANSGAANANPKANPPVPAPSANNAEDSCNWTDENKPIGCPEGSPGAKKIIELPGGYCEGRGFVRGAPYSGSCPDGYAYRMSFGGARKTRSNKGVRRGPRTGRTRSGRRFRPTAKRVVRKTRKQRSNKGVKRGPYGPRTGRTRSGRRFRQAGGECEGGVINTTK
tara:strand:+ start:2569 stop:3621 length:1053 start_codon:yes stop_codon:yes gene_type:complete